MNFGKEGLPIHLPDDFIELVNEYHTSFTANQIKKIDSTLNIISKKNHTDKPTNKQVELAKEWCSKYDVTINKHCYYL